MQKLRHHTQLGENIRALRLAAGMTQEEVARQVQLAGYDMSRSIYSQIESGSYNIRVEELIILKKLFNATYDAFFEGIALK